MGRLLLLGSVLLALLGCEPSQPPASAGSGAPATTNPYAEFGTSASNVFFYYADLEAAAAFYSQILGMGIVADYGFAKIVQVAPKSFITLVDAEQGMHGADEPKTAAIALVTDQLDEWWDYLQTQNVNMRSTAYDPLPGRAHHGFVAIDTEGYFLEFERFNPHPENEQFMPVLDQAETLYVEPIGSDVPTGLGFKSTIVWFYYRDMDNMQRFYEDVMGFELIVDQGWAKIYPIGPSAYFGLVDESRGMHSYTEQKGVTLSFITNEIDSWFAHLHSRGDVEMRHGEIVEEQPYRAFVAYDPEGYCLEWDVFNEVPENEELLQAIYAR